MTIALIFSALLMGLAGSAHCLAMCGAASTAAVAACGGTRRRWVWGGFHLGRVLSYGVAGAVAATTVAAVGQLGAWSPALRPLWTLAHMAALLLGLWLLWKGHQPAWLDQIGRSGQRENAKLNTGWQRIRGPGRAAMVGSLWALWPCGLLQSALMVAALANGPVGGAAVMVAFALASSVALGLGPALVLKLCGANRQRQERLTVLIVRLSGAALALASIWALGHGLWMKVAAYCLG